MPAIVRQNTVRRLYQAHAEWCLARGKHPTDYREWVARWRAVRDCVILPDLDDHSTTSNPLPLCRNKATTCH